MLIGPFDVLGLKLVACDHAFIIDEIRKRISKKKSLLISPLASQTFIQALYDSKLKSYLDNFDFLFSDSLWVKKSLSFLYKIH